MADLIEIPGPRGYPLLGNVSDIDPEDVLGSIMKLADTYGDIFKIYTAGRKRIFICGQKLADELCDEKRFGKKVAASLRELRLAVGQSIFTGDTDNPVYMRAHRILVPALGPLSMRGMFPEMHDIASQLVMKWARSGDEKPVLMTDEFTRLALDTIGLCTMDMRFNSFYTEEMHPLIPAMIDFLTESSRRAGRPEFLKQYPRLNLSRQKYYDDVDVMHKVARECLERRRRNPTDKKDVLNAMIHGKDPVTGEKMPDQNILENMITLLVAGHETTSGFLSFLFFFLINDPAVMTKVRQEVDDVVGRGALTVDHLNKLPYLTACLRETLRLYPTAPGVMVGPNGRNTEEPIILGGKYKIEKTDGLLLFLPKLQRDKSVYGEDAEDFRPERMMDEHFNKLPNGSWKPFGNGVRSCIGRPFAWQEALITAALLLQNFDFRFADPNYKLKILRTITIKPNNLYVHATLRAHVDVLHLERNLFSTDPAKASKANRTAAAATNGTPKDNMMVLYGGNSGTCEGLATSLAQGAGQKGYAATVQSLEAVVDKLPTDQPIVIICSSYDGEPPDNAKLFVEWLQGNKGMKLGGVRYAVFCCGNHEWVNTFHKVPKLIDQLLEEQGATRIAGTGHGDMANNDIFNEFDQWQDEVFWPTTQKSGEASDDSAIKLDINTTARLSTLRQDVKEAIVVSNTKLTPPDQPPKHHLVLKLPQGMTYKAGDYLAVLALNDPRVVRRALRRFGLPWDAVITLQPGAPTSLPIGHPISGSDLLGSYVELSQPATRKKLADIMDGAARDRLQLWATTAFEKEVLQKRRSVLDILEAYPDANVPFSEYLAMLPPMRIRQYSISSSPLADSAIASITWGVLEAPAKAGDGKIFLGVASSYLSQLQENDRVHVAVKQSHSQFHPPDDVEKTPMIMACAGTGMAPFRGFIEERAKQLQAGQKLAPAHLFFGCHAPDVDLLFKDELKKWEAVGAVQCYFAFSQKPKLSNSCKYVQDRVWRERQTLVDLFRAGANVYVCGSSAVGEGVTSTMKKIYAQAAEALGKPKTEDEVDAWFRAIRKDRFASDVFD